MPEVGVGLLAPLLPAAHEDSAELSPPLAVVVEGGEDSSISSAESYFDFPQLPWVASCVDTHVCLFCCMDFEVSLQLNKFCFFAQCAICLLLLLMHVLKVLRSIYALCANEMSVCRIGFCL